MSFIVKEIFYTLQGEGANVGRPAVFCRFSGCNLWSGREQDRAKAICKFCDTDFVGTNGPGGGKFATAQQLAAAVANCWPMVTSPLARPLVVCTGGEPLLQMDGALVEAFHAFGFKIALETNGTRLPPPGITNKAADELKRRLAKALGELLAAATPEERRRWASAQERLGDVPRVEVSAAGPAAELGCSGATRGCR
jgi:7-carboxy-7-deazaguanine synthase (Cx14CxxC type)